MSADTYTMMSIDELIQHFAETAKRAGTVWNDVIPQQTPEHKELVRQMQAMGDELAARKPIGKLRCLFEDKDRDVRGWSGCQFLGIDPEWASATLAGLNANLTVREVLALRRRVLEGPPPGPPLKDMTIEQLIDAFKDACTRLHATTRFLSDKEGGGMDMTAYNHVVGDSYAIAKELASRGKLDALASLLDDSLITTRERAATYCLPVATDRSLAVLEAIKATKTWPEMSRAWDTLNEFRNGTYRGIAGAAS